MEVLCTYRGVERRVGVADACDVVDSTVAAVWDVGTGEADDEAKQPKEEHHGLHCCGDRISKGDVACWVRREGKLQCLV